MSKKPKLIALSAGGKDKELAQYGLGIEHVDELMVRLSRKLLQGGYRLAYGGTLVDPHAQLTQRLIEAALGWLDDGAAKGIHTTKPKTWPLVNYAIWPYHTSITPEMEANLVGVCHFIKVSPPHIDKHELTRLQGNLSDITARRYTADALTEMRRQSASDTDLRIVWAGKVRGAIGWMAGIAEEVFFSLDKGKPTLIFGGFGGCARILADYLRDREKDWPKELTFEDACTQRGYEELIKDEAHRKRLAKRYDDLKKEVGALKKDFHSKEEPILGIPKDIFNAALRAESTREAIQLAARAAGHVVGND